VFDRTAEEVVEVLVSQRQEPGMFMVLTSTVKVIINQHRHRSLTVDTIAAALARFGALLLALGTAMVDQQFGRSTDRYRQQQEEHGEQAKYGSAIKCNLVDSHNY
jgi:hypothetical protein